MTLGIEVRSVLAPGMPVFSGSSSGRNDSLLKTHPSNLQAATQRSPSSSRRPLVHPSHHISIISLLWYRPWSRSSSPSSGSRRRNRRRPPGFGTRRGGPKERVRRGRIVVQMGYTAQLAKVRADTSIQGPGHVSATIRHSQSALSTGPSSGVER